MPNKITASFWPFLAFLLKREQFSIALMSFFGRTFGYVSTLVWLVVYLYTVYIFRNVCCCLGVQTVKFRSYAAAGVTSVEIPTIKVVHVDSAPISVPLRSSML